MRCNPIARAMGLVLTLGLALSGCTPAAPPPATTATATATSMAALEASTTTAERAAAWAQLPAAEQARLHAAAAHYAALSPSAQAQLRAQFDAQDPVAMEGWLLGPEVGAHWLHLSPLFAYVPDEEREENLALLHSLPPQGLEALARLAFRLPASERATFRAQLLGIAQPQRAAWLAAREAQDVR